MSGKIGLEMEFHLIDGNGQVANSAPEVLSHPLAGDCILPECGQSMIEVVAPPGSSLQETFSQFRSSLETLHTIADDLGLSLLPSSTVGRPAIVSNDPSRPRGLAKRQVLGDEKRDLEHHVCGIHVHLDRPETDEDTHKAYLAIQALDPLFTLMSSTPFFLGENTKRDYRVDIYRNHVFADFPLQGQLLDYPATFSSIMSRQDESYRQWRSAGAKEGFTRWDTMWGPLRLTPKTIEVRSADANTFSRAMALASALQGVLAYLAKEKPEVIISDKHPEKHLQPGSTLYLPSFTALKEYEGTAILHGLSDDGLHEYVSSAIGLARKGLDEQGFLEPFLKSLAERKTFSDEIMYFAESRGYEEQNRLRDENAAACVRKYIADSYREDFARVCA